MITFPFTLFSGGFENVYSTEYNGVDEWTNFAPNSIVNDLSVFAWVNIPNNTATRTIAANYHSGIGQRAWSLSIDASGSLRLRMSSNGTSDAKEIHTTSFNVENNGWHFVGFTYNTANQAQIYVDGVKETTYSGTDGAMTDIHNSTTDFSIAALRNGSEKYLGDIDEVTVWKNTVLSDANIVTLYNSGVPIDPATLSTSATLSNWYRMGDGDNATTIFDNVGSINGTHINTPIYTTDVPL